MTLLARTEATPAPLVPVAPAPAALRVVRAPAHEPPYDDELADPSLSTDRTVEGAWGHLQPLLPLRLGAGTSPTGPPLPLRAAGGLSDEDDTPVLTPTASLPSAETSARVLVQAVLEVLTGDRSLQQLTRAASPEVLTALTRRAALEATRRSPGLRAPRRTAVRSVRVCHPADGVAEVTVVVQRGVRTSAVALRLEGHRGAWRATELLLG